MIPHRDVLLVTGADDVEGLAMIAGVAEPLLDDPRRVSGDAFIFENGKWAAYTPPVGHPAREKFRLMARVNAAQNYEQQKQLIDKKYEAEGTDIFVGSVILLRNSSGVVSSLSSWAYECVALLPRTDNIAIATGEGDAPSLEVPWERASEIMADQLKPQGMVPERYLVDRSPAPHELDQLRSTPE